MISEGSHDTEAAQWCQAVGSSFQRNITAESTCALSDSDDPWTLVFTRDLHRCDILSKWHHAGTHLLQLSPYC